jgi:hypothetical protein
VRFGVFLLFSLLLTCALTACSFGYRPEEVEEGSSIPPGPEKAPFGIFERSVYFFGADPGPSEQLATLRRVHEPVDGSHRLRIKDVSELCREAVEELRDRDYSSWPVTAHVINRVSRLSSRDPSALVRREALETLAWFRGWVRPLAEAAGKGVQGAGGDPIEALRTLKVLREDPSRMEKAGDRNALRAAAETLGSQRLEARELEGSSLVAGRLSSAQRALGALIDGRLTPWREDPHVRNSLDRATLLVADRILLLTFLASLGDEVPFVRSHAASILEPIGGRVEILALARVLTVEDDPATRLLLIETTGRLVAERRDLSSAVAPALAAALFDADEVLRRAAARALNRVLVPEPGEMDPGAWRRWWREHARELMNQ